MKLAPARQQPDFSRACTDLEGELQDGSYSVACMTAKTAATLRSSVRVKHDHTQFDTFFLDNMNDENAVETWI